MLPRPPTVACLALIACALAAWCGTSRADPPLTVLLLSGSDAEITARVRGQTRDLPLALELGQPADNPDRAQAEQLARARGAQVVVWTEPRADGGLTLQVLDIERGALRSRGVAPPPREALAASTTAEIAALVVRSELTELLAERDALRAQAAAPVEPPQRAPVAPPPVAREAPSPPPPRAEKPWQLVAGYRPSLPLAHHLSHAAALDLRRELGRFALGVGGYAALPLELSRGDTRIRLRRFGVRVTALRALELARPLRLWLGLSAGLSGNARSTRGVARDQLATADQRTFSATFGAFAELHWRLLPRLGLSLAAGLDAVPWPTQFAYRDGTGRGQVGALWWCEPWLIAGLFTRFGAGVTRTPNSAPL